MLKRLIYKLPLFIIFLVVLILEAQLAWPTISLAVYLWLFNQVKTDFKPLALFFSAVVFSVIWPMSVLLALILLLVNLIILRLIEKLVPLAILAYLISSWGLTFLAMIVFKLNFTFISLIQVVLSLFLTISLGRFSIWKFKQGMVSFE